MDKKEKSSLINWFEHASMKDILPKEEKYDYSATGIEPNSRVLCVGSTGSGKTQSLLNYIHLSPNLFSRIIVFYKETEYLYELLQKGLKGRVEFHNNLAHLPKLKDLRQDMEPQEKVLLVIDDWLLELKNYPNVNDYFIYGRKKNITLFCLAQSYFPIPKTIRNQMTYLLLFKMTQKRDINLIVKEFSSEHTDLAPIYKEVVATPLQFLKITTAVAPDNKKISRNFIDYLPYQS